MLWCLVQLSRRHHCDGRRENFFPDGIDRGVKKDILVDLVNQYTIIPSMKSVATHEAKTHLSALLQEVSRGETIVISRGRMPMAKLVPYEQPAARPKVGEMIDTTFSVPEEALRPMNGEEMQTWGL